MAAKVVYTFLLAVCLVQAIQGDVLEQFQDMAKQKLDEAGQKVQDIKSSMEEKVNSAVDQMSKQADQIPDKVAHKMEEMGKEHNLNTEDMKDCINQAQSDASAAVQETKDAIKNCVQVVKQNLKDYVDKVKGTVDDTRDWAQGLISNTTQCLKEHFFVMCAKHVAGVAKAIPIMLDFGKDFISGTAFVKEIPLELGKCSYKIAESIVSGVDNIVSKAAMCVKDKAAAAIQQHDSS